MDWKLSSCYHEYLSSAINSLVDGIFTENKILVKCVQTYFPA